MSVEAWLGRGGLFERGLPGFETRAAQLSMAHAVERALREDGTLLVEAGTGTGKTLAYLVPALSSGKKVVISTGTKTLQDQIVQRDLPLIEALQGSPLSAACMKGLANYLCLRRFEEFRRSAGALIGPGSRQLPAVERWRETTQTGDRSELNELASDAELWHEIASSSETRVGSKCKHFDACFVTRMRRDAEQARLIIVNHHLYFADLALRGPHGGGVIPDHDAVIFDEAHLIEDVATDFFGVSVSTSKLERLIRDAQGAFVGAGLWARGERLLASLGACASRFFETLPRPRAGEGGRVPLPPETFVDRMQEPMFALDNALDALWAYAKSQEAETETVAQIARRADQIRTDVASIAEGGPGDHVTWTLARGRSVSIGSSPVEMGSMLRERLFLRGGATVLTSATLSTGGSFQYVKARFGLEYDVDELCLSSPFDYPSQAALYLPRGLGDPRSAEFLERAAREILELIALTEGGAFVLCTSLRAMRELASRVRVALHRHAPQPTVRSAGGVAAARTVLLQGEAPNAALLDAFRADGDAVLFATAGFWQGVDVPGSALRLVIIDKLPFEVPSDPLVAARCHRLKARGEEPFMRYLVPSAALTLKQGFGRLIRSRQDRGIVALLDERVSTKGYGRVFLRSLPPARRCETLDELRAFWLGAPSPGAGELAAEGGEQRAAP
jgi:ATP-dependent DNA helicase DinG